MQLLQKTESAQAQPLARPRKLKPKPETPPVLLWVSLEGMVTHFDLGHVKRARRFATKYLAKHEVRIGNRALYPTNEVDKVLRELAAAAFGNAANDLDENGAARPLNVDDALALVGLRRTR